MFYGLVWIDGELEFFGELSDLRRGALEIESEGAAGFGAEDDVLRDRHRLDQHKVLVDHADAEGDRVVGRLDVAHLAVDENLSAVGGVETVSDAHRGRLSRAVFSYDGMNGSGLDDDVDLVVSQNVAEAFGDLSEFEHSLNPCWTRICHPPIASVTLISPAMIFFLAVSAASIASCGTRSLLNSSIAKPTPSLSR